jgi:hypothetical protein
MAYIDNVEEVFTVFSDCGLTLRSNLYRVTGETFKYYAVADNTNQALDNLADNSKLLSIELDDSDYDVDYSTPLGSCGKSYDLQYIYVHKVELDELGTFEAFISKALEDKLR